MSLHEYKDLIGALAGIFTILQIFSPALLCWDFVKVGSTKNVDIMPFIGGLVLSALFFQHAILINDSIMLYVNAFSVILYVIYLILYFSFTKNKSRSYIKLSQATIFTAVLIGYAQRENEEVVQFRFGIIITLILFAFIASPLLSVKEIIKTKDTSALPIPLIVSSTVVTLLWLLYGLVINDVIVQVQNACVLLLNVFQLGLFVYCKLNGSKPVKNTSRKKSTKKVD